ncbi:exopolyphosphatase [Clostridia bacterium]|nr:exopolyphosphatase [Clostridia bacterium]
MGLIILPKKNEKNEIKKGDVTAVIDVGSNETRLRIAQIKNGTMNFLESASYPLSLGADTFTHGRISFDKLEKVCGIIKNFITLTKAYDVKECRVVATTAVRESTNRDYILDQIKIKTGVDVTVIDDSEEKLYVYKLMAYLASPQIKESALMVYTGSGNVGLSVWEHGQSAYADSIRIGSLRVSELFGDIQDRTAHFYSIVEDYLRSFIHIIDPDYPKNIKHFITSGQEIAMIAQLTGAKSETPFTYIEIEKLNELFEKIKPKTTNRIAQDYNLPLEQAEILLPALCIYSNLVRLTSAKTIITPRVFLPDAIMLEMLSPEKFLEIGKEFDKNTILCARVLAAKYRNMEAHSALVEKFALKIFDKMKKLHGMGKRERLLLQSASILHDIGKFINIKHHAKHSQEIIEGSEIIGLSELEKKITAQISRYHSTRNPSMSDLFYAELKTDTRVLISKLTAILKIADSLDGSHEQKFGDIEIDFSDAECIITISTDKNIDLEIFSFNEKRVLFQEVFGIKAVVKKKRVGV